MTQPGLTCQKHHFGLPEGLHYLNCAFMGPLPDAAEEAGIRALRRKRVPTEITPADFFSDSDRLRERFAALVGAPDPGRVAIHPAVSYGMATAARNLAPARGQRLLMVAEQFPGTVYTWRRLAAESGAHVDMVPRPPGARAGEAWNQAILEAVTGDTAAVILPAVHWTDGTRFDLEAIGRAARSVGAALVVDGTQSVGALPFDVAAVQPDVLVVAAYKWLLGPYSVALTYLSERFDLGVPLEETWIGRRGSEDFKGLVDYTDEYQPGAVRYDVGERSNFALLPVAVAALDLVLGWRPERIAEYTRILSDPLVEAAAELGFGVEEAQYRSPHLFGLKMPEGLDLQEVRSALEAARVSVSLRGSALRISPNVYNDEADTEALLDVLRAVVAR